MKKLVITMYAGESAYAEKRISINFEPGMGSDIYEFIEKVTSREVANMYEDAIYGLVQLPLIVLDGFKLKIVEPKTLEVLYTLYIGVTK